MKYMQAGDVCQALETPYRTVDQWIRKGLIRPTVPARGHGRHRLFAIVPDVLAIAIGRGMRASGFTLKAAGDAMEMLMNVDEAKLNRAFAEGRTHILVMGGGVYPELVKPDAIVDSATYTASKGVATTPVGIDVRRVFENLMREASKIEQRQRKQATKVTV